MRTKYETVLSAKGAGLTKHSSIHAAQKLCTLGPSTCNAQRLHSDIGMLGPTNITSGEGVEKSSERANEIQCSMNLKHHRCDFCFKTMLCSYNIGRPLCIPKITLSISPAIPAEMTTHS